MILGQGKLNLESSLMMLGKNLLHDLSDALDMHLSPPKSPGGITFNLKK
jgi:hypothetical protein